MTDTIFMKEYGFSLTGREFGKISFVEKKEKAELPVVLDFTDVKSIGSSFADEFVAEFAKLQGSKIIIKNANRIIKECLEEVAEEKNIEVNYL